MIWKWKRFIRGQVGEEGWETLGVGGWDEGKAVAEAAWYEMERKRTQIIIGSTGTSRIKNGRKKESDDPPTAQYNQLLPLAKATQSGEGRWRRQGVDSMVPPTCWFRTGGWRCDNPVLGVVSLCGSASCSCVCCSWASGLEWDVVQCSKSRAAHNWILTGTAPGATGTQEVTIPPLLLLRLSGRWLLEALMDVRHNMLPSH